MNKLLKRAKIAIGEFYLFEILYNYHNLLSFTKNHLFEDLRNKKKAIITLLPTHGNLGDHAIALASKRFIEKYFPEYHIIEVEIQDTYKYCKAIRKVMNNDDLVFIIGGGNLGSLYKNEEITRQYIISTFKKFKITQLPATVHFENNPRGLKELNRAKKVYNSHSNLTLIARDSFSFNAMKEYFTNCRVLQNPDMVLFTAGNVDSTERKGISLCLRKDKESYFDNSSREDIVKEITDVYKDVSFFDTVLRKKIFINTREKELELLWSKISNSEVIVTDRLHGMIFCAKTMTPCVVLPSFDHKVREGYEKLKGLNYIKFIEDPSSSTIISMINELRVIKEKNFIDFDEAYFSRLRSEIMCES